MSNENKPIEQAYWVGILVNSPIHFELGDINTLAEYLADANKKSKTPIEPSAEMSEEELEKLIDAATSNGENISKYLSKPPRIANGLIGYHLHKSHHAEMQKEIDRLREEVKRLKSGGKTIMEDYQ